MNFTPCPPPSAITTNNAGQGGCVGGGQQPSTAPYLATAVKYKCLYKSYKKNLQGNMNKTNCNKIPTK